MRKIGLTGGIGSGKTTVSRVFEILGFPVYNSDSEAKRLMQENELLKKTICAKFGENIYDTAGVLDRSLLADIVFHDSQALQQLNALVHPVVRKDFEDWASRHTQAFVVQESAILIESGAYKHFDFLVSVVCSQKERIERVLKRDKNATFESVNARITMQTSDEERMKFSHMVLKNGKDDLLLPQIEILENKIKEIC